MCLCGYVVFVLLLLVFPFVERQAVATVLEHIEKLVTHQTLNPKP